MVSPLQILEVVGRVLGQGTEYDVAQRLLDFLSKHSETTHVSLQLVRQLTPEANAGALDSAIVRTLQLLSGDAVHVLDVGFEIFDAEEHPHQVTREEARAALEHEVDPLTGAHDPQIGKRLAMYFIPTAEAMESLHGGSGKQGS